MGTRMGYRRSRLTDSNARPSAHARPVHAVLALALLVLCGGLGQLVQIALSPDREGCIGLIIGLTLGAFPALALSIVYGGRD